MITLNRVLDSRSAFALRLLVGAVFGIIIATLIETTPANGRNEDLMAWRGPLTSTLALVAFPIWAGAGAMRRISLLVWACVVFVVIGYINWTNMNGLQRDSFDVFGQAFLIFPLLFIAHELVSSGDQSGKLFAPFETYFDEAWKRGVQLALAILFTLLFWGILWLGAALLGFIGFDWLEELLGNSYFALPIIGLAFGTAVHLGDVQTKLLANVRNLILGVLSWLLPVITLIGGIFAASLLVSGLAPLWATKAATATLLGGCIGFVLLINAAYQQGDEERHVPIVLKWCVRGAAILLLTFAVLAAWSLGLRIGQYGLTSDRVFAGLGVIIALAFGVGYTAAVFLPGRWMGKIEPVNIGMAVLKCALFIAVLTPVAAPVRLGVNDQVARLNSGKVSIDKFDWWLLMDETGAYGKAALTKLAASSNPAIATKAKAALANELGRRPNRDRDAEVGNKATPANIAAIPVIFPADGTVPTNFTTTDFTAENRQGSAPSCLKQAPSNGGLSACKIALLDLNRDNTKEVLVREGPSLSVFSLINGVWQNNLGYIDIGSLEADFDAGKISTAPAQWDDVIIGGVQRRKVDFGQNDLPTAQKDPVITTAP